ncbi:MAG: hypothetical protein OZSIB_0527 [Candidatus Ozemobacter sibiricus]|uniref:DUF2179 domain-containing protein n=1 Tax=Candidatus Ozemobacter sibiricus TaxID=2268124 RepID=A0A367ZLJ8_9BACT|nr:MAG: hypothetical protein OZSIB_0527 [Candidatus Ozemobacter sibiricus]
MTATAPRPVGAFDLFLVVLGSVISTLGLVCFTIPNKIAAGGLTGLATVLYFAVGLPVGAVVLTGNLALIAAQMKLVGFRSAGKTVLSVALTSVLIELLMRVWPISPLATDPILACLYGGILSGIGVGVTFRGGGTTGGVDIVAQICHHLFHWPIGDVILVTNFLITIGAGFVFGPQLALYGLITVFFSGWVVDAVLEGIAVYRSVLIITQNPNEVAWAIMEELHRGVTCIDARGMYTSAPTNVLLVAVRRMELPQMRQLIYEFDPNAFVIVGDARQVLGRGFLSLGDQVKRQTQG